MVKWQENVLKPLQDNNSKLGYSMIQRIDSDRDGYPIDAYIIKRIVDSLIHLGNNGPIGTGDRLAIYKETFEVPFLSATANYYEKWSTSLLASNPTSSYLFAVEDRLRKERSSAHWYLHFSTVKPLSVCCVDTLISRHIEAICEAFQVFLARGEDGEMRCTYNLLSCLPNGLQRLRDIFMLHVKKNGLLVISDSMSSLDLGSNLTNSKLYIESLMQLRNDYKGVITNNFGGDSSFTAALDIAYSDVINRNSVTAFSSSRCSELLAREFDLLLRKQKKGIVGLRLEDAFEHLVGFYLLSLSQYLIYDIGFR